MKKKTKKKTVCYVTHKPTTAHGCVGVETCCIE